MLNRTTLERERRLNSRVYINARSSALANGFGLPEIGAWHKPLQAMLLNPYSPETPFHKLNLRIAAYTLIWIVSGWATIRLVSSHHLRGWRGCVNVQGGRDLKCGTVPVGTVRCGFVCAL